MEDKNLINKLKDFKKENGYTLYELSKRIDIHIGTLGRWLKTGRINRIYAQLLRERLSL